MRTAAPTVAPAMIAGVAALEWLLGAVPGWGELFGEVGDESGDVGADVSDAGIRSACVQGWVLRRENTSADEKIS